MALKHPHGGFLSDLVMYSPEHQSGPTKIVGRAFTVKFVRNEDADAPKPEGHYVRLIYLLNRARLTRSVDRYAFV
jgi:hypothetical protein